VVHRFTTLELVELAKLADMACTMARELGVEVPEYQKWADRLFDEVVAAWCEHCDSAPAQFRGLCKPCYEYNRTNGTLPDVQVIRRRLQRTG
jgi:hypothetical protein